MLHGINSEVSSDSEVDDGEESDEFAKEEYDARYVFPFEEGKEEDYGEEEEDEDKDKGDEEEDGDGEEGEEHAEKRSRRSKEKRQVCL